MAKSEYTTLEVAGREVRLSNPAKVYFPKPGWTKLDLAQFYIEIADAVLVHVRERPTVMKRFVNGIMEEPIWQKRVPQNVPEWLQTATVAFPSGRTAEELVANDAAHLVWAVNLGVIDFNPWPARRARPRPSRRAARRPRPHAGHRVGRRAPDGDGRQRRPRRARPARLPEDLRLQGHPRQRADRAALGLPRRPPRRAGARARGRAAHAAGHEQVVEGGAPRRLRRLQPERARPHCGVLLLRPPDARRAGLVRAALGRGAGRRAGRPAPRHGARAPAARSAIPPPTSTSAPARSSSCSTWPAATRREASATRRGRRTSRSRRTSPSACSRAATATGRRTAAAPAIRSRAARRPACRRADSSAASAQSPGPARGTSTSSTTIRGAGRADTRGAATRRRAGSRRHVPPRPALRPSRRG